MISPKKRFNWSISTSKPVKSQYAYDALLSAMRAAPSDETVFEASLAFVREAARDSREDSLTLADDIHQRGKPYPISCIGSPRESCDEHTNVGKILSPKKQGSTPDDPLAEVDQLLDSAAKDLPTFVRTRLLHDAETELGNQAVRMASFELKTADRERFWKRCNSVKERL